MGHSDFDEIPWFSALTTYFAYSVLMLFGQMRDFFARTTGYSRYLGGNSSPQKGYAPLLNDWENFFTRRMYHRAQDCFNRPITGPPGANRMQVAERVSYDGNFSLRPSGKSRPCINLGSYNYLGFADDWRATCRDAVVSTVDRFGVGMAASIAEGAYTTLHRRLERTVAEFVGKPDAIVFNMGYGTNATALPALMGKGTLIVSDALNHTSIVNGARASGAVVRVFGHNDIKTLEGILRTALVDGQPRTRRPWKKIVVVVEGVYSMEGEMVNLPAIVSVAKKYKAYIYLDEAHSIGAVGKTGRGVCEHFGVDPGDVDVMMGTFTKSFGAMGGYIAASKEFIDYLRHNASGSVYTPAMAPSVTAQVLRSFDIISGRDGSGLGAAKLQAIKDNANYFRKRLIDMGCDVYGHTDSPVIPVMLFDPCKNVAMSRALMALGVAVVVVGFPATPLLKSRVRFCISAGHTREVLDTALEKIELVVKRCWLDYRKGMKHDRPMSALE